MIQGYHPTLLKVTYQRPSKKDVNQNECFQVIYADDQGDGHYTEEPGEADIYIVKPEYRKYKYNKPEERMEKMDKIRVPISKIKDTIIEHSGEWGQNIKKRAFETKDWKLLDQLYRWPYAYECDFQPEYYFMKDWYEKYELNANPKISKCYLDIEVDQIDYKVDMDHIETTAYAPVNCASLIFEELNEGYQFVLKPFEPPRLSYTPEEYKERYAMYQKQLKDYEYLRTHQNEYIQKLHQEFDSVYGWIDYHVRFYDEEIDLIADIFRCINTKKPNWCLIWNMRFDIKYLYHRIVTLGYDPKSIMCSPEIPSQICYFREDKSTFTIAKQYDFFHISAFTQYICQMRLYSAVRKSGHQLRSVKLNAIADKELKDKKVEYEDETDIVHFPYFDFIRFLIYNVKDTLLQKGIGRKTNDLIAYYMRSHKNLTPYNKIYKETHLLRNVREKYFERDGWVQGNNLNIIGKDEDFEELKFYQVNGGDSDENSGEKSFKGAINADPVWNDYIGLPILGARSNNLFRNVVDFDMGAFYPSCKIASNMDGITLLYKAAFNNNEFISGEFSNKSLNQQYEERDKFGKLRALDITGEAVNTFVSGNILTFGYNYFNLPDLEELDKEVTKIIEEGINPPLYYSKFI